MAGPPQGPQHTGNVGRPIARVAGTDLVQVDLHHLRRVEGGDPQAVVVPPCNRGDGRLGECDREAQPLGVVNVLAYQVHPPGGEPEPVGGASETLLET